MLWLICAVGTTAVGCVLCLRLLTWCGWLCRTPPSVFGQIQGGCDERRSHCRRRRARSQPAFSVDQQAVSRTGAFHRFSLSRPLHATSSRKFACAARSSTWITRITSRTCVTGTKSRTNLPTNTAQPLIPVFASGQVFLQCSPFRAFVFRGM